ncbi:MAG: B3/4 domain-containing protein [Candidatus Odinarchaeota archaeon]
MYQSINVSDSVKKIVPEIKALGKRIKLTKKELKAGRDWSESWNKLHQTWKGKTKQEVASHPRITPYIDFYKKIGLNPKKNPPSVQNLIQRFLIREPLKKLPAIHPLVDAINVAVVESLIPLGIFDAETIEGDLILTITKGGEPFEPLGAGKEIELSPGVLVLRDEKKVLSQYGVRDSNATKVNPETESVWILTLLVPGIEEEAVKQALDQALELIQREYDMSEIP